MINPAIHAILRSSSNHFSIILVAGSGVRSGKIIQRFPETDWPDTPFIEGIEWVCTGTDSHPQKN